MEIAELISKVKHIEVKSRLLSDHVFAGEYHTAFKGRGMHFSEVREYSYGDDVRHIDWNVTARMQHPFVKLFEEERELTVNILIDISASSFLSAGIDRFEFMSELAAVLAFSVVRNQDKVGLFLFDNEVRKYIPPSKSKAHLMQIVSAIAKTEASQSTTDINVVIEFFQKVQKRRSVVFLISDFLTTGYKDAVKQLAGKHDLIGVAIKDALDSEIPDIGIIPVQDSETGIIEWVDTSDKQYRKRYQDRAKKADEYFKKTFLESKADTLYLDDNDTYLKELQTFFHRRASRR